MNDQYKMSEERHKITPHLSEQASKLKLLLEMDDERRRQEFIRNISGRNTTNTDQPPREAISALANNQASVEHQLQEQVNFYENALVNLRERSEEISVENKKLYQTMNKSFTQRACSTDEEDNYDETPISRPKERLLRTKAEFRTSNNEETGSYDVLDSFIEPGQVNAPIKSGSRGAFSNTIYDLDNSCASEPGQIVEVASKKNHDQDTNAVKQVTFGIDNSHLSRRESDFEQEYLIEQTRKLNVTRNVVDDVLPTRNEPFQSSKSTDNLSDEMRRMQDLYETKTKHLEALLKTARKQVEEREIDITNLKGELRIYKTPVKEGSIVDISLLRQGLVKPTEKKLVEELLREREELFEAIKRQQHIVAEGNRHETEAYYHVKKSCEMVEQAQLEKQEAIVRMKQLEKDVNEYKEKYQNMQKTHQEELIEVSKKARQEMDLLTEELNKKVEEQAINLTVLQSHLEKSIREKMGLKNELDKFERHNASQHSTSNAMIEESQKEVMEALKRQTLAEHETGQIRLEAKLNKKRKQQEVDQLTAEVNELKRRLHVTEESLNLSQKSQLDITNQLNSCKQQLQQEISRRKMLISSFEEEKKRLLIDANQREEELSQVIHETDKCYQLAKAELTRMLESQTHIVSKYQSECKELSEKVSVEQRQHQLNITQLKEKCLQLETNLKDAFDKEQRNDVLLKNYKQQVESAALESKQKKELVMLLMTKQSAILRDRYLLTKEVELLKSQLPSGTLTE